MPKTIPVTREQLEELRKLASAAVGTAWEAGAHATDYPYWRAKSIKAHDLAMNAMGAWFDERELELRKAS